MILTDKYYKLSLVQVTRSTALGDPNTEDFAKQDLTFTGLPLVDETIALDGVTYTWKVAANSAGEVTIGGSIASSIANLVAAVNGDANNAANPNVGGSTPSASVFRATALVAGAAGNTHVSTTTMANATWGGATLLGGFDKTTPDLLGQVCLVGDNTNKLEFLSVSVDPILWILSGPNGVVADPNNPGDYIKILTDGDGALAYEPYDLTV